MLEVEWQSLRILGRKRNSSHFGKKKGNVELARPVPKCPEIVFLELLVREVAGCPGMVDGLVDRNTQHVQDSFLTTGGKENFLGSRRIALLENAQGQAGSRRRRRREILIEAEPEVEVNGDSLLSIRQINLGR